MVTLSSIYKQIICYPLAVQLQEDPLQEKNSKGLSNKVTVQQENPK